MLDAGRGAAGEVGVQILVERVRRAACRARSARPRRGARRRKKRGWGGSEFKRSVGRSPDESATCPSPPTTRATACAVARARRRAGAARDGAPRAARVARTATRTRSRSRRRPRSPLLARGRGAAAASSILATTSPPYDEGGSVQALAELLGLAGDLVALELTASLRDGLTALRRRGRARRGGRRARPRRAPPTGRAASSDAGDGAVALLLGRRRRRRDASARGARAPRSCATAGGSPAQADAREGDPSFVWDVGVPRVARDWELGATVRRSARSRRAAGRAERALGGPGDDARAAPSGVLGAAHPLARLLLGLGARAGRRRRRERPRRGASRRARRRRGRRSPRARAAVLAAPSGATDAARRRSTGAS